MINRFVHSMCTLQLQVRLVQVRLCQVHLVAARPLNRRGGGYRWFAPGSDCAIHSLGLEFTVRSGNSYGEG